MDKEAYQRYVAARAQRSPLLRNAAAAFAVGGGIGAAAEALYALYCSVGIVEKEAGAWVSVTVIFLTALLTGLGIFDRIGRFAGAGTLVPVTGFANSVVSPALDDKSEGLLLGVGAKIFRVSGPVLLFSVLTGTVYGVIYYLVRLLFL